MAATYRTTLQIMSPVTFTANVAVQLGKLISIPPGIYLLVSTLVVKVPNNIAAAVHQVASSVSISGSIGRQQSSAICVGQNEGYTPANTGMNIQVTGVDYIVPTQMFNLIWIMRASFAGSTLIAATMFASAYTTRLAVIGQSG